MIVRWDIGFVAEDPLSVRRSGTIIGNRSIHPDDFCQQKHATLASGRTLQLAMSVVQGLVFFLASTVRPSIG